VTGAGLAVAKEMVEALERDEPLPTKEPVDSAFENEIVLLLQGSKKIEAIKVYRERTGVGLKEAKDAVEALERGESLPTREPLDSTMEAEIVRLLEARKKIEAIKVYRERTGVGLKEAKDAVEAVAAQRSIVAPSGSGCLGAALLLMVLIPMAAMVFGGEQADHERHADYVQGTITAAPDEKGTFIVQPQGTTAPCAKMKVTTDPKTVVTLAQEKIKVANLKVGMWVRAEMVGDVATRIVAGHLWLEDGERLVLFKGLPEEFFTHPAGFDVNNVPTKFGPLRMMYRLTGNGSYLRWGQKALPKEGMVVCWPTTLKARFSFGQPVKPDDQGMIHLPADVSELRIWFADHVVPQKPALGYDTYSGYFVSNKFEPDDAESLVVLTDQEQFDKVFGVAFVMNDKSHRLPNDAFKTLMVVAAIKRGSAIWEFKVTEVVEANGVVEVHYTATSKKSDSATFACPLIVSIPKGKYRTVQFVENGKTVKKLQIEK
jgi:ribosomal protein L7/L12